MAGYDYDTMVLGIHQHKLGTCESGFVSILDDTTNVLHTVFLKNSSEIIRRYSESLTARSRYSDGVVREKRHSTNVVFALRRELKGVFGISLPMRRSGRNRSK